MPTTRARHLLTETDEVADALDDAARLWPEETSRARLAVRLLLEGHRAVRRSAEDCDRDRCEAIRATSGILTGVYGPDYLRRLREEWPE